MGPSPSPNPNPNPNPDHSRLEQEVEAFHGGLESRAHEVERISLERDAAQRAREEQLRQVEQLTPTLNPNPNPNPNPTSNPNPNPNTNPNPNPNQMEQLQQTIAEQQAAVDAREQDAAALRLEHMKLKNHIETLESSGWGAAPAQAAASESASASAPSWRPPRHPDLPSFDALWREIEAAGGEQETMRSDTTLSVGEWPEELRM